MQYQYPVRTRAQIAEIVEHDYHPLSASERSEFIEARELSGLKPLVQIHLLFGIVYPDSPSRMISYCGDSMIRRADAVKIFDRSAT